MHSHAFLTNTLQDVFRTEYLAVRMLKRLNGALKAGRHLRASLGSYGIEELARRLSVFPSGVFEPFTKDIRAATERHKIELIVFVEGAWLGLIPWWLTASVVARDVLIGLGALTFRLWFGPLHGRPTAISKVNTGASHTVRSRIMPSGT